MKRILIVGAGGQIGSELIENKFALSTIKSKIY